MSVYLDNWLSNKGKMIALYWIRPQISSELWKPNYNLFIFHFIEENIVIKVQPHHPIHHKVLVSLIEAEWCIYASVK